MNQQIKFRVWDTKGLMFSQFGEGRRSNGNVLYFDYHLIHPEGCGIVLFDENGLYFPEEGRYVVQQFTGLLDKNGREIYEGDIVLYLNSQSKHEIERCIGGFKVKNLSGKRGVLVGAFSETNGKTEFLEIIGNIFENPELLK